MFLLLIWGCSSPGAAETATNSTPVSAVVLQETYAEALASAAALKKTWLRKWKDAGSAEKEKVLEAAGSTLSGLVTETLIPHWYGTKWDFNGTSQTPGEGMIACGYFITTLLRDAGIDLPRVKLAQQASAKIMRVLDDNRKPEWLSGKSPEAVRAHMLTKAPGLYIIGLDYHTGFLLHDGAEIWFIHSSYIDPPLCVVKEKITESPAIAASGIHVIGRVSTSDYLVKAWLTDSKIDF